MNEVKNITTTKRTTNNYISEKYEIVSKVGYLIGVHKEIFENENEPLRIEIFHEMQNNKSCRIIRNLSIIRTNLERNFAAINTAMRYDLKNLNSLPEFVSQDSLKELANDGINIIKANRSTQKYIIDMNMLIRDNIGNCKDVFPIWINWSYIRRLFIMPNGSLIKGIESAARDYYTNLNRYPYQQYINWHEEDGNILYNDKKFVTLLYKSNGDTFLDINKVTDASEASKSNIYNFLDDSENAIIVVDCENSDPYKLYAMLKNLNEQALINKVKKIILCDDVHTTRTWSILEQFTEIPVEYELVERVKENKSLVDHKLIAKTCREVYRNDIDSVLLFSSDSDYWGLISGVTEAKFMVMVENGKCGPDIKNKLVNKGIPYVYIDDFCTGNCYEMTISAVLSEFRHRLNDIMNINLNEMLDDVCRDLRTNMSIDEKKTFYNKFLKTIHLCIADTGDATVEFGK